MNKYAFVFDARAKRGDYRRCEIAYVYADTLEDAERIFDETARTIYAEIFGVGIKKVENIL